MFCFLSISNERCCLLRHMILLITSEDTKVFLNFGAKLSKLKKKKISISLHSNMNYKS